MAGRPFASRAGAKLDYALRAFAIGVEGQICADFGSNVGGFVDCLLRQGASRVYAVERGYGVLAYGLRTDARVVVMERTDALQVRLPEPVRLLTIDMGWTRQTHVLPAARRSLAPEGEIISLIKPHYEAALEMLRGGVLAEEHVEEVLDLVRSVLSDVGLTLVGETESPIRGTGGNREFLWHLRPSL